MSSVGFHLTGKGLLREAIQLMPDALGGEMSRPYIFARAYCHTDNLALLGEDIHIHAYSAKPTKEEMTGIWGPNYLGVVQTRLQPSFDKVAGLAEVGSPGHPKLYVVLHGLVSGQSLFQVNIVCDYVDGSG